VKQMMIWKSHWPVLVLAFVLVLVGVASVAYAAGVNSGGPAGRAAATAIPGRHNVGHVLPTPRQAAPAGLGSLAGPMTITAIKGTQLTVRAVGGQTRTIDVSGATITRAGQKIAVSGLKVGDQITARQSRKSDGSYKITAITVLLRTVSGTVESVGPSSVTISGPNRSKQTITLTDSTTYTQAGAKVSQSALVTGAQIVAQGSLDSSGSFVAISVTIAPSVVTGTVAGKTSSAITVTTAAGKTVTVKVSSSTGYVVRGVRSATLADVAVGDRITAQGTLGSDGSLTATIVQVLATGQRGSSGSGGSGSSTIPRVPSASPSGPST
jgi:hypothetical protein